MLMGLNPGWVQYVFMPFDQEMHHTYSTQYLHRSD